MLFSKKWLQNHQKFLLHFLIHIDVLMLCRKFELIPTSIFQVMAIFKFGQFLKKSLYYSPWFFPKNGSQNYNWNQFKILLYTLDAISVKYFIAIFCGKTWIIYMYKYINI